MVEHCISAFKQRQEETGYRTYLTDALMAIANNTAIYEGSMGMTRRWAEAGEPRDERDGDEIVKDIVERLELKYRGEDEWHLT